LKDIIRVATAIPPVRPGNVDFNISKILSYIEQAKDKHVRLLLFPELSVTGYTCGDLFFSDLLLDEAESAVLALEKHSKGISFAVGAPLRVGSFLCNCAFFYSDGSLVGIVPKTYIPNYCEFSEKRYFTSGASVSETSVGLGGREIPFGTGLVFDFADRLSVGIEICEDLWAPAPPSSLLSLGGADILLNLSASPEAAAKREYRRSLVVGQSARTSSLYIYASAGYTESTSDFICSGHSIIAGGGVCLAENKNYVDSDYLLSVDVDIAAEKNFRRKITRFADAAALEEVAERIWHVAVDSALSEPDAPTDLLKVGRYPFIPEDNALCRERVMELFEMQSVALAQRLALTGCRPVIGISGGLDSTLALLVCVSAVERLGKPADYVLGVTMPCFGTTGKTLANSLAMMERLGIESRQVNIGDSVRQHFADIGHSGTKFDAAYENSQARERTQVLMDLSNMVGGLVVGTGDLSELALGWCTYNGDHMSMYAVNASLPKTLIRRMVDELAKTDRFAVIGDLLHAIVEQPVSPELLPPDAKSGEIAQVTEDIVGPYELHDFFIYYLIRYGYGPEKILGLATIAFDGVYSREVIKGWLAVFARRFFTQQFKRSCAPDGIKLGTVGVSPHGGWNVPTDADGAMWRREIERL